MASHALLLWKNFLTMGLALEERGERGHHRRGERRGLAQREHGVLAVGKVLGVRKVLGRL
jgi:hypothetical protein